MTFKQTWWDQNLDNKMDEFLSWVGTSDSQSKVFFRNYVKENGYKSLIDLGCGPATEFFAYKKEYSDLKYLGVDSSEVLCKINREKGVPILHASAEQTGLEDNHSEVSFSRHLLEHQPSFEPILRELIRIGSKISAHIFFIEPNENEEHIGYDHTENLYHNRYNKFDIENFLSLQSKVQSFEWIKINDVETALIIKL